MNDASLADMASGIGTMGIMFNDTVPMGFAAGDLNLYRYAGNNPINKTDPSGLEPNYDLQQERMVATLQRVDPHWTSNVEWWVRTYKAVAGRVHPDKLYSELVDKYKPNAPHNLLSSTPIRVEINVVPKLDPADSGKNGKMGAQSPIWLSR